jgi:SPP1 gp7 family putative phage head morphogenesis protein
LLYDDPVIEGLTRSPKIKLGKSSIDFDNSVFDDAMKFVYQNGSIAPEDILKKDPRRLVGELNNIFSKSITQGLENIKLKNEIPETVLNALKENVFVFSGIKTYHELKDASLLLVTPEGQIKPFDRFYKDVQGINDTYNKRYLESEYGYAVHSAQMAGKWQDFEADGDDYRLQYRTAGDDKVRADHAILRGTTLPMTDPFWDSYTPPLDWGCRCTVVQVRAGKYPESNSAEAQEYGKEATTRIGADGTNKLAMFRTNPGKTLKIFPDKHPYYPRGCENCDKNIRLAADIPGNELCQVCKIVKEMRKNSIKESKENS